MATKYYIGAAEAVAQVSTVQITGYDAATSYRVTINNITVAVAGVTDASGTASALKTALQNKANSGIGYFRDLSFSVATDTVTITGRSDGAPFTATSSVSGGSGTIGSVATPTPATSKHHWDNADNWSGAAVPVNSDIVVLKDSDVNIRYGLGQGSVTLTRLEVHDTFTGEIGLQHGAFARSADGSDLDRSLTEYRETHLTILCADVRLGASSGERRGSGSAMINLDLGSTASQVEVIGTALKASIRGGHAVNLLANSASTDVHVLSAPGGVGVAALEPGETTTIGDMNVIDRTMTSRVECGVGTTTTNWVQFGGRNKLRAAGTVTKIDVNGGALTTEEQWTATTVNCNGGVLYANNWRASGTDYIGTLNMNGGTFDAEGNTRTREVGDVYWHNGDGAYKVPPGVHTYNSFGPASGRTKPWRLMAAA